MSRPRVGSARISPCPVSKGHSGKRLPAGAFRAAVNGGPEVLRLRGLDSGAHYAVRGTEDVYGGDELMNLGLTLQFATGDDASYTVILERVGA